MNTIKRYRYDFKSGIVADSEGGFVGYADYAALAEQVRQLTEQRDAVVAENVKLTSGITYFAFAPEYGFDYFSKKQAAIDTAQAEIDAYREDAFDGWDEDVRRVSWGIVVQKADGVDAEGFHISDHRHTYQTCDYKLIDEVETPVTDAILDSLRAEARAAAFSHAADSVRNEITCLKECSPTLKEMACLANEFDLMARQLRESKGANHE